MCTTTPPVHVAITGIEKIVEKLEHVPPLLSLLTRSATGQNISTYFNMISGPRKPGEKDGPSEVHLVLLDNGRSQAYADEQLRKTLQCIRCGACMNHCPVYTRIGGHAYGTTYPGPIGKIISPHMLGLEATATMATASSLCGACGEVCPVKIPIPELLMRLREESFTQAARESGDARPGRRLQRGDYGGLARLGCGLPLASAVPAGNLDGESVQLAGAVESGTVDFGSGAVEAGAEAAAGYVEGTGVGFSQAPNKTRQTMSQLITALRQHLPETQVITDELRRLAYGTDASFYRLTPEVIAVVESENDLKTVLTAARQHKTPVTFRAAGTSLSGQAITDGVLALIGEGFATCEINADASKVKVGPGIIGGEVNRRLAPFGKKIGPDPASINACKIGGIAANNASGMCCGTAQNSYRTLAGMRVMLADGTLLDSEDPLSVDAFSKSHAVLLGELEHLGSDTRNNAKLAERIRHKFKIKNTTGYSLNALVDYEDPIDILAHLMIGSEGTLGFISRITYQTVVEDPFKASALVFFPDIRSACEAVIRLKPQPVSAVELLDRPALRSVQDKPGLPPFIMTLGEDAAALLIEVRSATVDALNERISAVHAAMAGIVTVEPLQFSTDPATCEMYWKVRKGTFPSVGAMRRTGTTVIIEDVAFPIAALADATLDLQALLRRHGYDEAIIFGHALEGNLHFVFTQDFGDQAEIDRYARFMDDVCDLVVKKYDGSLKAEHGTGRNMAPFVEMEWGKEATDLMRTIKRLFDPDNLLNPGVILNDNAAAHLENLKPMPAAEEIVDRCIECGFCEPLCPSHRLTLSPRQRIVSVRELARRAAERRAGRQHRRGLRLHGPRHLRRLRPVLDGLPGRHRHR